MTPAALPNGTRRDAVAWFLCAGLCVAAGCGSTDVVAPSLSSLRVVMATTGVDIPRAGMTVTVDAAPPVAVPSNGDYLFAPLGAGHHQVTVGGVAPNCTSSDAMSQAVQLTEGVEDSLTFDFTCTQAALDAHGLIAFARVGGDGQLHLWEMNSNGTGATDLGDSAGVTANYPSWTPDGAHIVFIADGGDLAIIGRDGAGFTKITTDGATTPAVSPDGSTIAYAAAATGGGIAIWTVNLDGSNRIQRSTSAPIEDSPTWSPDGTQIAFRVSDDASGGSIYVMHADGSNMRKLSGADFVDATPAWSPNGSRIAFSRQVDGQEHLAVMNADGSDVVMLTSGLDADESPSWSADGSRIVFWSQRGGGGIWVMNADGTNMQHLSPPNAFDVSPAWGR